MEAPLSKVCTRCHTPKSTHEFYQDKRKGHRAWCKACCAAERKSASAYTKRYNQAYYAANKPKLAAHMAAQHQANKEQRNAYSRSYYRTVRRGPDLRADILARTKSRAKRYGVPFAITLDDIVIPEACPVLGIPIAVRTDGRRGPLPNSPSIDRINPTLGYVRGNVRIISNRANTLKSDATIDEIQCVLDDLRRLRL